MKTEIIKFNKDYDVILTNPRGLQISQNGKCEIKFLVDEDGLYDLFLKVEEAIRKLPKRWTVDETQVKKLSKKTK